MSYFNVRVYGILLNEQQEVLLSDESKHETYFTKFPGGGLELGEGLLEGLKREYIEECQTEIEIIEHIYTTDFFEKSTFNDSQVISIYYLVKPKTKLNISFTEKIFDFKFNQQQSFRWKKLTNLSDKDLTFKTDQVALSVLKDMIFKQ